MKLTVTVFTSVDGVVQAPGAPDEDTADGFDQGGWLVPHFDGTMMDVVVTKIRAAAALLLGRGTYEIFAAHWPRIGDEDPVAAVFNRIPKYVVSTTVTDPGWRHTTVVSRDVVATIEALKQQSGGELQVHGSPGLVQTLLANDLVDEIRLWTAPVLLGRGKRLFTGGAHPTGLSLAESLTTDNGVVYTAHRPAGAPVHGTFALDT